jgi:hypothetical protein
MTALAQTQPDAFVLDTSALLRLYLPDGPLPPSLKLAMQRGCSGDRADSKCVTSAVA